MHNTIETNTVVSNEEISVLAYLLWEKAGRPTGRDLEFWDQAEKQLFAAHATKTASPKAKAPVASPVTVAPAAPKPAPVAAPTTKAAPTAVVAPKTAPTAPATISPASARGTTTVVPAAKPAKVTTPTTKTRKKAARF